MVRRLNEKYINGYDRIILTQPLAHGTNIQQIYEKDGTRWRLSYASTSVHHICPYDGVFRNCRDCGALDEDFDLKFCTKKTSYVSSGALVERIVDCKRAGLSVTFTDQENVMEKIDNRDCYWYYWRDEENPCCLEEDIKGKGKPCYLHILCYYYVPSDGTDDYIRKLLRENERLKLIQVKLP